METSGIDFLRVLAQTLKQRSPQRIVHPTGRHACIAAVFRVRPQVQKSLEKDIGQDMRADSLDEFLDRDWVKSGTVQLLFIKRAVNERDRWSGDVALPGGRRQESDPDDQSTAERETLEEISLDISNRNKFICLGQIDDLNVIRGRKSGGLVVSCFAFLQTATSTPPLQLQEKEIASFRWVNIETLINHPRITTYTYSIASFFPSAFFPEKLLRFTGIEPMHFPATPLQPTLPSIDQGEDISTPFNLWGMTLGRVSEILHIANHPPLNRPPMVTNNVFANWFIRLKYGPSSPHGLPLRLFSYRVVVGAMLAVGYYLFCWERNFLC